jgi:hypothetical protein
VIGHDDVAKVFDSAGPDEFVAHADRATMTYADGRKVQADDFHSVMAYAFSDAGPIDTAHFYDTTTHDEATPSYPIWFHGYHQLSKMYSLSPVDGRILFYAQAAGFDEASASADGDDDTAKLFDSAQSDAYSSRPDYNRMDYYDGTFAEAWDFRYMYGYSYHGPDTATLYDQATDGTGYALRFQGHATWSKLYTAGLYSYTEGFAELRAALTGDDDKVYLFDDPTRDDHLVVCFPVDAEHPDCTAKLSNDRRAIYVDDFLTLTAITAEEGDDDQDVHDDYIDQVILDGTWADAP